MDDVHILHCSHCSVASFVLEDLCPHCDVSCEAVIWPGEELTWDIPF